MFEWRIQAEPSERAHAMFARAVSERWHNYITGDHVHAVCEPNAFATMGKCNKQRGMSLYFGTCRFRKGSKFGSINYRI